MHTVRVNNRFKNTLSVKPKQPRWSHQFELDSLKGKGIALLLNGVWETFTLLEADQYTVKVQRNNDSDRKSVLTYNKSAYDAYQAI